MPPFVMARRTSWRAPSGMLPARGRARGGRDARVPRADDGHIIVAAVKLSHQVLTSPHKTA